MLTRIEVSLVIERATLKEQKPTLTLHCVSGPCWLAHILTVVLRVESSGTYRERWRTLIRQSQLMQSCLKPTTTVVHFDTTSAICKVLSQTSTARSNLILVHLSHFICEPTFVSR